MNFKVLNDTSEEFIGTLEDIISNFNLDSKIIKNKIENLLNEEINKNNKHSIIAFKGTDKEFRGNLKEISSHFNINYNTLKGRIRYGYSLEDAIDWNKKIVVFRNDSREFSGTRKEIAEHFNINYSTLNNKIRINNISMEEAINYFIDKKIKRIIIIKLFIPFLRILTENFLENYQIYENILILINKNFIIN